MLFSSEATGLPVQLPGWTFPVVCQPERRCSSPLLPHCFEDARREFAILMEARRFVGPTRPVGSEEDLQSNR